MSDITERQQAEKGLREREETLRATLHSIGDAVISTDMDGLVVAMNPVAESLTGWSQQEATGQPLANVFQIINEQTRQPVASPVTNVLKSGQIVGIANHTLLLARDGREIPIADSGAPIRNDAGEITGVVLVFRDQTKERAAQKALEKEKAWSENIVNKAPNIIVGLGERSTIKVFNRYAEELTGYKAQEVIGKEWINTFIPEELWETIYQVWDDIVKKQRIDHYFENEIITRSGEKRLIEWHNTVLTENEEFQMILSIGADITERRRAEAEKEKLQAQLLQAQKMESVGRLAGGVAHDFNNMLSVIQGYTELALRRIDPEQPLFGDLQQISKAAKRSAELTRQLLTFARKQTIAPKVIDLNETVERMLKMLRRLIGEDIDLSWQPDPNPAPVKVDPTQIDQILANLCVNSRDAIADVGKITIETGVVAFDEAYCAVHAGFLPGEYVLLAVSDNGCGMDRETVDHLFEPFFTTKEQGKGTGLGLASLYGAVKQNNGFINVYSEPGQGTTVKVYLPRHQDSKPLQAANKTAKPPAGGGETILLVEDEPAILHVTTTLLKSLGYVVIAAATPGEAIRLAHEHSGSIDLLMTDVVMPEMNGRDLAKNLLSIYPGIKRLFMSGYTANVIAHHGVLDEGVHFLQKPFSLQDLGAKLGEVLGDKNND
ncbi:MAG: PAS domain S-box protein [Desulfurivibrio sp.]|nr:PAS domain S-box protein [Desulfurivibrio sp.]